MLKNRELQASKREAVTRGRKDVVSNPSLHITLDKSFLLRKSLQKKKILFLFFGGRD
jgi:hypothetical protein